ncbi:MAG: glycine betaine ABC transporter substrate-binding protein, partial [Nocardioidaceae bacterium]
MFVRRTLLTALAAGTLVLTAACGGSSGSGSASNKGSLTISGQNFPEATLMADMYQQLLQKDGYTVSVKLVGTRDVYM